MQSKSMPYNKQFQINPEDYAACKEKINRFINSIEQLPHDQWLNYVKGLGIKDELLNHLSNMISTNRTKAFIKAVVSYLYRN